MMQPSQDGNGDNSARSLVQLMVACEFSEFGVDPHLIAAIVCRHWLRKHGFFQAIDLAQRFPGDDSEHHERRGSKLKIGVDIPTPDEIKRILQVVTGRGRVFLLTDIFTGLRASEMRGLSWKGGIDFKKGELHVIQRADRFGQIGKPKTESAERTIPLPSPVVSALREWKLACPKGLLDLVFPDGNGNVEYLVNIVQRIFWPAQIAAGVTGKTVNDKGEPAIGPKYTGLHSLRHFHASWCINRKVDGGLELPPKVVQQRMGHSSIVVTMDTYGHLFPRADDSAELTEAASFLLS